MTGASAARAALGSGAWQEALGQVEGRDDLAALEVRAQAAYGSGDLERAIVVWEQLHRQALAQDDAVTAARAAATVALYLLIDTGLMSAVRSWTRRAEQLLGDRPQGPVHALLAMVRGHERLLCGDRPGAGREAAEAVRLGREYDVPPAVLFGTVCSARVQLSEGDLAGGLDALDAVAAILLSGAADALTTGMMYCELICAAQNVGAHDRAMEWTEAMQRWSAESDLGSVGGRCQVHRAELLRLSGPGERAETAATAACEALRPWLRRELGWPLVELGDIRRRRGDLTGAESAYLEAQELAWSAHPGLALVRLAQGRHAEALELVREAREHPAQVPSKEWPPIDDLALVPVLDAQSEIAAVLADHGLARESADVLEGIAASYPGPAVAARASLARCRERRLAGAVAEAVAAGSRAVVGWVELGAPYEAGVARLELGCVQAVAGHHDLARLEWELAVRAFDSYGASLRLAEAGQLLAGTGVVVSPGEGVFTLAHGMRTAGFAGRQVVVPDLVGFRHLARLLAAPHQEWHVLDLVALEGGHDPGPRQAALPVLDDTARAAYRRRLADIEEDIEEARREHDLARLELAERDRNCLVSELSRAFGLGGRVRGTGSDAERARSSVARSIRYALSRLAAAHPELGSHLANAVHTGTFCRYAPELAAPVTWRL